MILNPNELTVTKSGYRVGPKKEFGTGGINDTETRLDPTKGTRLQCNAVAPCFAKAAHEWREHLIVRKALP